MRSPRHALLAVCVAAAVGCVTKPPVSDSRVCEQLDTFAESVAAGQSKTIRLTRGGTWMLDHYKQCAGLEGDAASDRFCRWLLENSSTEFMEVNINRTLSCLQGQRIIGYIGNTGIETWSGRAVFAIPKLKADVRVEVAYAVDYATEGGEDFLNLTVSAR